VNASSLYLIRVQPLPGKQKVRADIRPAIVLIGFFLGTRVYLHDNFRCAQVKGRMSEFSPLGVAQSRRDYVQIIVECFSNRDDVQLIVECFSNRGCGTF